VPPVTRSATETEKPGCVRAWNSDGTCNVLRGMVIVTKAVAVLPMLSRTVNWKESLPGFRPAMYVTWLSSLRETVPFWGPLDIDQLAIEACPVTATRSK